MINLLPLLAPLCAFIWRIIRDALRVVHRRGLMEGMDARLFSYVYIDGRPMIVRRIEICRRLNEGDTATIECIDPLTHLMSMRLNDALVQLDREQLQRAI
jgi:hypothetical protein